jgi:nucleoside-diphosphate-sugar epimerase
MLVIKLKEKAKGNIFNVGSNEQNFSMEEIATKIVKFANSESNLILHDKKDKYSFVMNCDKIEKELGFGKKYDLEYGINEILTKLKHDKN